LDNFPGSKLFEWVLLLILKNFTKYKQANIGVVKDGNVVYPAQSECFLNTEISNNPDITFHFTSEINMV